VRPEAAIADNLLRKFEEIASVFSPALRLIMPLQSAEPVEGETYLEAQHLPNITNTVGIANNVRKQHIGFLQVTAVGPITEGIIPLGEVAADVVEFFKQDTIIDGNGVRVKINRQPTTSPALKDGAWLRIAVSIPYVCSA
jgi:hypothetical protein